MLSDKIINDYVKNVKELAKLFNADIFRAEEK
jgi:hypothetical protein